MRVQHRHRRLRRSGRHPGSGGDALPAGGDSGPSPAGKMRSAYPPSRMMEQKVGRAISRATETDPKTTFLPKTN